MKNNIFGQRLKELRTRDKKMTQEALARELQISKSTLSNYETGYSMPDIETLIKIATYFHVSTDHLLGRTKNILREDEIPYTKENKIDFFKKFTSPDPREEGQLLEGYIARPYFAGDTSEYLFAYEMNKEAPYHLSAGDIVYAMRHETYRDNDLLLVLNGDEVEIKKKHEFSADLAPNVIGCIIGIYKSIL